MARTHGRIATYVNGCRCDECRRASYEDYRRRHVTRRRMKLFSSDERAWLETEPEYFHERLWRRA